MGIVNLSLVPLASVDEGECELLSWLRFPPEIIGDGVWLCHRLSLGFRDVEELVATRGIIVRTRRSGRGVGSSDRVRTESQASPGSVW